jgi:hypothetical protein
MKAVLSASEFCERSKVENFLSKNINSLTRILDKGMHSVHYLLRYLLEIIYVSSDLSKIDFESSDKLKISVINRTCSRLIVL